jgi:hypothetical protein
MCFFPPVLQLGNRKDDLEKNRKEFFESIQGGSDINIEHVTDYIKKERTLPGSGVDTSKQGSISVKDAFFM